MRYPTEKHEMARLVYVIQYMRNYCALSRLNKKFKLREKIEYACQNRWSVEFSSFLTASNMNRNNQLR